MGVFAVLRRLNPVLLAVALPVLVAALVDGPADEAVAGLAFWLLAVLEHINYFHTQLMYDNAADLRRLRTSGPQRAHLGLTSPGAEPARIGCVIPRRRPTA